MRKMTAVHDVLKRHRARARCRIACATLIVSATVACAAGTGTLDTSPAAKPLPLFHLAALRRTADFFYGLTVMRCRDRKPYWTFGDRAAKGAPPDTVTYGVAPRGYETVIGPLPLDSGCYRVEITGGVTTRFSVGRDGRITALDDSTIVTTTTLAPPPTSPPASPTPPKP